MPVRFNRLLLSLQYNFCFLRALASFLHPDVPQLSCSLLLSLRLLLLRSLHMAVRTWNAAKTSQRKGMWVMAVDETISNPIHYQEQLSLQRRKGQLSAKPGSTSPGFSPEPSALTIYFAHILFKSANLVRIYAGLFLFEF